MTLILLFLVACAQPSGCELVEVYNTEYCDETECLSCEELGMEYFARASEDTVWCWW